LYILSIGINTTGYGEKFTLALLGQKMIDYCISMMKKKAVEKNIHETSFHLNNIHLATKKIISERK